MFTNPRAISLASRVSLRWGRPTFLTAAIVAPLAATAQTIELQLPIDCEVGRTCFIQNYVDHDSSAEARDYQCGTLTYDGHNGTDFRLPTLAPQRAGVRVLAAAEGQVLRVRDGVADALQPAKSLSSDDRACGNGIVIAHAGGWETQYCHLAKGSVSVKPGDRVAGGQAIGLVGLSGRTQFPHVHLTVRHEGRVVDPFALGAPEGSCGGGAPLWSPSLRAALAYRERLVLNAGFAPGPVTAEQIEAGEAAASAVGADAAALVVFARAVGLRAGDVQRLSISGPEGRVLAETVEKPLDHSKAQYMLFVGKKRPDAGWATGTYRASYSVTNAGKIMLEHSLALTF
jgi:hypothetical protein